MGADAGGGPSINTGRHGRKRVGQGGNGLMLASMLDILMAILFFLLKNYSSSVSEFNIAKDLQLPSSTAVQPPIPSLSLQVTTKGIMLDDQQVVELVNGDIDKKDLYRDGITIVKLAQALKEQKERSLYIQKNNDAFSFNGTIVMQADKGLKFNVLKKVIYTAGISDFVMMKLAVLKIDQG